jgi:hypothetical protein
MSFLARLFSPDSDTTTVTFDASGAPEMPITATARSMTFQPQEVTVELRGARLHYMLITGPTTGHPQLWTRRRFTKSADVPEWARAYITEAEASR